MIAMMPVLSMTQAVRSLRRLLPALLVLLPLAAAGCATRLALPGPPREPPAQGADAFVMPDGARLPYRVWLPPDGAKPWAVMLALHGMNDSRDAWEIPAPDLARAGIAVYAPDQRGFGATGARGYWPGGAALVDDARVMAGLLRARNPGARLFLMGESMGGAVLMCLAAAPSPPPADAWVFIAPAVWGRAQQTLVERAGLWLAFHVVPGLTLSGAPGVQIRASDNHEALVRLSRDPLTIHDTRVDALEGLVDLMDAALAAAPAQRERALFLYGGHDDLIPKRATRAAWSGLPAAGPGGGPREAYYADGYHLLLRDLERAPRIADVLAWLRAPDAKLPSGSDRLAAAWLAEGRGGGRLSPPANPGYALR
jgi:alpha-beta hydrolase superfamily lysophospholipase